MVNSSRSSFNHGHKRSPITRSFVNQLCLVKDNVFLAQLWVENSLYHWRINLIQFLFNFDHRLYLFIVHTWLHQDWNPNLFSKTMNPAKPSLNAVLLLSVVFPICFCLDTITPDQPIKDGQSLVSNHKTFALGFFSPGNSNRRYVGIGITKLPNKPLCGLQIETILSMIPLEFSPSMTRETSYSTPKTKPFPFGLPMFLFRSHPQAILWLSS